MTAAARSGARARSQRLFICSEIWHWRAIELGRKPRRSKAMTVPGWTIWGAACRSVQMRESTT